jgi:predicted PurR-regulated permease PerM
MRISFQKVFYTLATVVVVFMVLFFAKTVLIPLTFAFLIACILFPLAKKVEFWGASKIISATLAIACLLLLAFGTIAFLSNQIIHIAENLIDFKVKVLSVFTETTLFINNDIGFFPKLEKNELLFKIKNLLNKSAGALLSQTFNSTANIIFGLLTSIIFAFLILIYRKGIIHALVSFYPTKHKHIAFNMFQSVQRVGQQYFFGMMVIVLILGVVNSVGLWIIGIENPFLFGFLAALLALIPYAGTFLGAAIPVLYSFLYSNSVWTPITIAIYFWLVQLIESNYLTPKIVGGNLKINAFTSIISIIIGNINFCKKLILYQLLIFILWLILEE